MNMKVMKALVAIMITLSLYSCDLFMSSYQDSGLTVSLGDNSARAITTTAPALPSFGAVTITVYKGGSVAAGPVNFTGNGPYRLNVSGGSGYTVKLEAAVSSPTTFGLRYEGQADNVSTGSGTVQIHLSVSGTMIVGLTNSGSYKVFSSFSSASTDFGGSLGTFFFDRYGRFYRGEFGNDIWQHINPADSTGQSSVPSNVTSFVQMAHPIGSDIVYLTGVDINNGTGIDYPLARSSLSNLDAAPTEISNATGTGAYASFDPSFGNYKIAVDDRDGAVFLGGEVSSNPAFIKGMVSGSNFDFIGGKTLPSSITDMRVFNGILYTISATTSGIFLQRFNASTLAEIGTQYAIFSSNVPRANIAGWNNGKLYVSWDTGGGGGLSEYDTGTQGVTSYRSW
jgi:hypothetical protein